MKNKELTKYFIDLLFNESVDNNWFKFDLEDFEYKIEYEENGTLKWVSFGYKNDDYAQTAYSYTQFVELINK